MKCEACRTFYCFFTTSLINSIIQEHKVLDSIYHIKLLKDRIFWCENVKILPYFKQP